MARSGPRPVSAPSVGCDRQGAGVRAALPLCVSDVRGGRAGCDRLRPIASATRTSRPTEAKPFPAASKRDPPPPPKHSDRLLMAVKKNRRRSSIAVRRSVDRAAASRLYLDRPWTGRDRRVVLGGSIAAACAAIYESLAPEASSAEAGCRRQQEFHVSHRALEHRRARLPVLPRAASSAASRSYIEYRKSRRLSVTAALRVCRDTSCTAVLPSRSACRYTTTGSCRPALRSQSNGPSPLHLRLLRASCSRRESVAIH